MKGALSVLRGQARQSLGRSSYEASLALTSAAGGLSRSSPSIAARPLTTVVATSTSRKCLRFRQQRQLQIQQSRGNRDAVDWTLLSPQRGYASYAEGSGPGSEGGKGDGPESEKERTSRLYLRIGAATAVIGLIAWFTSNTASAEVGSNKRIKSSSPDYTHALDNEEGNSVPDGVAGLGDGSTGKKGKGKGGKKISIKQVLEKKEGNEVWVVIKGDVYNMTDFLDDHPGGKEIIVNNRSKDVTPIFNPRHPSDQLEPDNIPPNVYHLGALDLDNASEEEKGEIRLKVTKEEEDEDERIRREREAMEERGLGVIINMKDFEKYAEPMISKVAWAYYASAADDEITKNTNAQAYQKLVFRPRILRRVAKADCSTEILGKPSALPVYIAPAAMAKLGHPDGEVNLTKGAHNTGIIQCISSNASCSIDELSAARASSQPLFYQLYVNRNRSVATDLIKKLNTLDLDAIFLTGDAPVGGKRERDLRLKGEFENPAGGTLEKGADTQGVSQAMFAGVDPNLHWDDIKWIKSLSDKPIIVKGVQCVEDAILAYENGASGIVISNHGGRQLDTVKPSLDVLLEIRKHAPWLLRPQFRGPLGLTDNLLKNPQQLATASEAGLVKGKDGRPFEIFIDGGVWRGTDVVKALCLGANAVGVGRGFLFAQSVGGVKGVEHAVGILESEILLTLRLLGANKLEDLRPSMVELKECNDP